MPKNENLEHSQHKKDLGREACKYILFGHSILGCDTTSSVFGVGKRTILKLLKTNPDFQKHTAVFRNEVSMKSEIQEAGQAALLTIYNSGKEDYTDSLCYVVLSIHKVPQF